MPPRSFICGISGPVISREERKFLSRYDPAGIILFERNCDNPEQLKHLCDALREAVGRDNLLVLIDQEGGRVQRLKSPGWVEFPAAMEFGKAYRNDPNSGLEAVQLCYQLLAKQLTEHGVNGNCVPVLDLPQKGAHPIIGNRAYGNDPEQVIALGKEVIRSHLKQGVLPVMKHIPGHGRAQADSHLKLPIVDESAETLANWDYSPFHALRDCPAAMTAHILFTALDRENPVSLSKKIISRIIRGEIGFKGMLMSDDLSMGALSGKMYERTRNVLAAGCDLALHCNGRLPEMIEVADNAPVLESEGLSRYQLSLRHLGKSKPFDTDKAGRVLNQVLARKRVNQCKFI